MRGLPVLLRSPISVERSFAAIQPPAAARGADVIQMPESFVSGGVAGADGYSPFGFDRLTADLNPDLVPPKRFQVYNEMRNEDSVVRSALWLFKLSIRSSQWSLQPASQDPVDLAIADAVAWAFGLEGELGEMDLGWDEQLQQALLHLDFGSMFEEIVMGDVVDWVDADGDSHPLRTFARCAPRFPGTVRYPNGIQTDPRTGQITYLEQWLPNTQPIPGTSLVYYVLDREGTDWFGRSMLRPMYGPWKLKRAVMISAGMGWDRYAFGTPVVRYPKSGGQTRKREAEGIGRNWRSHERGWVVLEGAVADGWDVQIVGGNSTMGDPTPLVLMYNDEMRVAALQHFTGLGRIASGSRAVADIQVEPYYLAAQALADATAMQKMRLVFRRFIDLNFGTQFSVPTLNVAKMQAKNIQTLAAAIQELAAAGLNYTDADTQNDIRDALDLRHLPETAAAIAEAPEDLGVEATDNVGQGPGGVFAAREGDSLGL